LITYRPAFFGTLFLQKKRMESHDFSEIYEIGGTLMKEAIITQIIEENVNKTIEANARTKIVSYE
jgi:hypothetical protein